MSGRRGLNLSAAQIIASVLATLSAAVAASFLGVAGTLVGAAVGSLVSTMGTEIYKHYLQRSEERLRSAGQVLYHSAARTRTGTTDVRGGSGVQRPAGRARGFGGPARCDPGPGESRRGRPGPGEPGNGCLGPPAVRDPAGSPPNPDDPGLRDPVGQRRERRGHQRLTERLERLR